MVMEKKGEHFSVLYIVTKLELGGAQKVCLTLFNGVAQQGYVSGLVSGDQGVLVPEVEGDPRVHLLKELKREVGIWSFLSEFKAFFSLYRVIKKTKAEHQNVIVHTHSTKAGFLGRWAAFFAGVKHRVHTVHGYGFNDAQPWFVWGIFFALEYLTSLITTHYVCVSEKDRRFGLIYFPFFAKKNSLIRAAVEWDAFFVPARMEKKQSQAIVIGTVSCLKPQKNVGDLIQAFIHVYKHVDEQLQRRLFLHIIGDGALRASLEALVRHENMHEHIIFLGWQQDVASYMKGWDIFAMSSLWEGLPCAVVEARLAKLPVVAYRVGGVDEVVVDAKNGFVIEPGEWMDLAKKLVLLVQNDQVRMRMACFVDNLYEFKNTHMVQEHATLYKHLIR